MSMRVLIQTLTARTPLYKSPSVHTIYEIPGVECLLGFVGVHKERQTQRPWGVSCHWFLYSQWMANKVTADPTDQIRPLGLRHTSSEPHKVTGRRRSTVRNKYL